PEANIKFLSQGVKLFTRELSRYSAILSRLCGHGILKQPEFFGHRPLSLHSSSTLLPVQVYTSSGNDTVNMAEYSVEYGSTTVSDLNLQQVSASFFHSGLRSVADESVSETESPLQCS